MEIIIEAEEPHTLTITEYTYDDTCCNITILDTNTDNSETAVRVPKSELKRALDAI